MKGNVPNSICICEIERKLIIFLEIFDHRINSEGGESFGKRMKTFGSVIHKKIDNWLQYSKKTDKKNENQLR